MQETGIVIGVEVIAKARIGIGPRRPQAFVLTTDSRVDSG